MTSEAEATPAAEQGRGHLYRRRLRGVLVFLIGCLAIAAPLFAGPLTFFLGGILLIVCGVLEMLESYYVPDSGSRSAYLSGEVSILAGILLIKLPELTLKGVALFLGVSF